MRVILFASLLLLPACSAPPPEKAAPAKPPEPVVPPELQLVAEKALGGEAEVVLFGNLARTGKEQVFVVNRILKTPANVPPGLIITRAALLERDGGTWKEILRVDEHLKNPQGFLGGTPLAPVTGWRVQHEQGEQYGLTLFFTPIHTPAGGHIQTIGVRWNSKVGRYQSLDRTFEKFQGEAPALEGIRSNLR